MKWTPDTCECIINLNQDGQGNMIYESADQKCALHKDLDGQVFLDAVASHNHSFMVIFSIPEPFNALPIDLAETIAKCIKVADTNKKILDDVVFEVAKYNNNQIDKENEVNRVKGLGRPVKLK